MFALRRGEAISRFRDLGIAAMREDVFETYVDARVAATGMGREQILDGYYDDTKRRIPMSKSLFGPTPPKTPSGSFTLSPSNSWPFTPSRPVRWGELRPSSSRSK